MAQWETYWKDHDNGRRQAAKALLDSNPALAALVETVNGLFDRAGKMNQEAGVMVQDANAVFMRVDGKRVYIGFHRGNKVVYRDNAGQTHTGDAKKVLAQPGVSKGGWRRIGKITKGQFWPRQLQKEISRMIHDVEYRVKHPEMWDNMVNALIDDGHIDSPEQADKYLVDYFSGESSNDYYAGIEKARGMKLPEMFYDYSMNVAIRYGTKWSQRLAQIENFGQETDTTKDVFHNLLNSPLYLDSKHWLAAVRDNVYNVRKAGIYEKLMDYMNLAATGMQLGNPGTATINILGGMVLNFQHFGLKNSLRVFRDLVMEWRKIQQDGTELGLLGKDYLRIMRDIDAPAQDMFSPEDKIRDGLARFADFTMTWGGYKVTENFIRSYAFVAGRYQLMDAIREYNANPDSATSLMYARNMKKNGISLERLVLENGAGQETGRYLRRMVNIPQGSYRIDQVPLFTDTRVGRFLFKYQKFGTQVSKMFYDNYLHPFMHAKGKERAKHFWRNMMYFSYAIAGGTLILAARAALFGYNDPGPEDDDIIKALENEDTHRAVGMMFSKAWHSMMAASAFGFFGNYAQMGLDISDRQRVKNPLNPPGLATLNLPFELGMRWYEQGKLTGRDISEVAEQSVALYRANKRMAATAIDAIGGDHKLAKIEMFRRDRMFTRKIVRQFASEFDIVNKRTKAGRMGTTPMTPINKDLYDALITNNPGQARLIVREHLKDLRGEDRKKAMLSMQASARAKQPLNINGSINDRERHEFYRWARKNMSRSTYMRVREADVNYRKAMVRAGLLSSVGYVPLTM
jgi:hypothetical protein